MKRFTKFVSLLLLGAMLLSLCACGTKEAPETTAAVVAETAGTEPEATTETTPAANTVTDVLGREVEIPAAIETIACPGLPSTRMVVYAGAAEICFNKNNFQIILVYIESTLFKYLSLNSLF